MKCGGIDLHSNNSAVVVSHEDERGAVAATFAQLCEQNSRGTGAVGLCGLVVEPTYN